MYQENCENKVSFTNTSKVVTSDGTPMDGDIDAYYWDFGNGTTSNERNPTVNYGRSGGAYTVRLVASMSDDMCTDSTYFTLNIPELEELYRSIAHTSVLQSHSEISYADFCLKKKKIGRAHV